MFGNKKQVEGYTLLETVIYVGIFSVIIVSLFGMLFSFTRSFARAKSYNEMRVSGEVAMERIIREIRNASSVDMTQSVLGIYPGVLALNTTDASGVAKTIVFYVDTVNKTINLQEDLIEKGELSGSGVEVTNLVFYKVNTVKGSLIKVELSFRSKKMNEISVNFYDSVVLRGSY